MVIEVIFELGCRVYEAAGTCTVRCRVSMTTDSVLKRGLLAGLKLTPIVEGHAVQPTNRSSKFIRHCVESSCAAGLCCSQTCCQGDIRCRLGDIRCILGVHETTQEGWNGYVCATVCVCGGGGNVKSSNARGKGSRIYNWASM